MSRWRCARVVLVVAALALGGGAPLGCAETSTPVTLGPPAARYTAADYPALLERWTRHDNVILLSSLDNTLKVHATFLSPDFSAGYVARQAHVYRLADAERRQLHRELEQEQSYSFFVAAATPNPAWNDFDRSPSIWRLALVNDANEQLPPLQITSKKKITPAITDFYPYVGSFYRVYTIRFPKVLPDGRPLVRSETKQLTLRFAGPLGLAELSWRLQ